MTNNCVGVVGARACVYCGRLPSGTLVPAWRRAKHRIGANIPNGRAALSYSSLCSRPHVHTLGWGSGRVLDGFVRELRSARVSLFVLGGGGGDGACAVCSAAVCALCSYDIAVRCGKVIYFICTRAGAFGSLLLVVWLQLRERRRSDTIFPPTPLACY